MLQASHNDVLLVDYYPVSFRASQLLNWNRNLVVDLTKPERTRVVFNWERNISIDLTDPGRGLRLTLTGIKIRES